MNLAAAASFIAEHWPCFPCGADKRPITTHGFKDATRDAATLRDLFRRPGAALIGVPVPRSWSKRARADALAGRTMPTKKPDASNQLKLIEDALNGIVWVDDCQIVDGGFSKRYVEAPQTVLTVRRLP